MSWWPGWQSITAAGFWSGFYFWGSILSLISLGVCEVVSHKYSERKDELTGIQEEATQKRHDAEMAQVHLETAEANEKAAQLGKEAAQARLEQERLKAQLAWRTIPDDRAAKFSQIISRQKGKINVQHTANDPEALYLAIQFVKLFEAAKWDVRILAVTMNGAIVFGQWVPDSSFPDVVIVRDAFRAAEIGFVTDALPPMGMGFGSTLPDAPVLFIGSKRPE